MTIDQQQKQFVYELANLYRHLVTDEHRQGYRAAALAALDMLEQTVHPDQTWATPGLYSATTWPPEHERLGEFIYVARQVLGVIP